jgi:hypothetical protein
MCPFKVRGGEGGSRFSVVSVTTRYGVDGPGFDPGGSQTFRARPRQAQRPTQPPVKWVPSSFPGNKAAEAWY